MKTFQRFWLDTLKMLIQAAFAGLIISPMVTQKLSFMLKLGLATLFVILILCFVSWAKLLSVEIDLT